VINYQLYYYVEVPVVEMELDVTSFVFLGSTFLSFVLDSKEVETSPLVQDNTGERLTVW